MPFNCLLWHCLQPGESVKENNVTAVFQKKKGTSEAVLIFKTDHEEFKKRFASGLVCDFVFYYCDLGDDKRKVNLVFVELGGHKCDHSVSQLRETVKRITSELKTAKLSGTVCSALAVYSAGSSPLNLAKLQIEFRDQYQTTLKVKQGNRVDLRSVFSI